MAPEKHPRAKTDTITPLVKNTPCRSPNAFLQNLTHTTFVMLRAAKRVIPIAGLQLLIGQRLV